LHRFEPVSHAPFTLSSIFFLLGLNFFITIFYTPSPPSLLHTHLWLGIKPRSIPFTCYVDFPPHLSSSPLDRPADRRYLTMSKIDLPCTRTRKSCKKGRMWAPRTVPVRAFINCHIVEQARVALQSSVAVLPRSASFSCEVRMYPREKYGLPSGINMAVTLFCRATRSKSFGLCGLLFMY